MKHSNRDERGIALIMMVTIVLVAAMLAAVILYQGTSSDRHSGRGANWNQALQSADAGVEEAISKLQASNGVVPAAFTGQSADGTYSVTVTYLGRNRYQFDSIGKAGTVEGLATERHVRVVMGPPKSFKYALYSKSSVDTKNNDIVNGDIYANDEVTVALGDTVNGSVTSATKYVMMENGTKITGDVYTGGYDSAGYALRGTIIGGNVKAGSTATDECQSESHADYRVQADSIGGTVKTWSNFVSGQPDGSKVFTKLCVPAPKVEPFPSFTFNPANYDPAPIEFADANTFNTYVAAHKTDMKGTFVVGGSTTDGDNYVDITGIMVSGDLTIIANGPITADQGSADVTAANNDDKLMVLVSYYVPDPNVACASNGGNPGDCAIGIKNNFDPSDNTATLVYAPNGPVAFKNNAEFVGAVYASNIVMKNNQVTTYDARVEQIVGFGPVTLEQESWQEVND
jgi:Tfp pilus assembly protein PilX